jgi:DNA-binding protein Fis
MCALAINDNNKHHYKNFKDADLEEEEVEKVVEMLGGNKSKAAEFLGISRTSLWRILKMHLSPIFSIIL